MASDRACDIRWGELDQGIHLPRTSIVSNENSVCRTGGSSIRTVTRWAV